MFLELPGVGEAAAAALAGVQLDARVDLHVGLELVGLAELPAAHAALVGLLPGVDQQVAVVVLRRPELLATLVTLVRLDSRVQQLVLLQLRRQQEAAVAHAAHEGPVAAVLPQVVQVQVAQVEGLPTGAAGELLVLGVALLVGPQGAGAAEALQADLTDERFAAARPASARHAALLPATVDQLLVLLQLAVVEERLPTQVAHERFLHTVDQHVCLQSPGSCEALSTPVTPEEQQQKTRYLRLVQGNLQGSDLCFSSLAPTIH